VDVEATVDGVMLLRSRVLEEPLQTVGRQRCIEARFAGELGL